MRPPPQPKFCLNKKISSSLLHLIDVCWPWTTPHPNDPREIGVNNSLRLIHPTDFIWNSPSSEIFSPSPLRLCRNQVLSLLSLYLSLSLVLSLRLSSSLSSLLHLIPTSSVNPEEIERLLRTFLRVVGRVIGHEMPKEEASRRRRGQTGEKNVAAMGGFLALIFRLKFVGIKLLRRP